MCACTCICDIGFGGRIPRVEFLSGQSDRPLVIPYRALARLKMIQNGMENVFKFGMQVDFWTFWASKNLAEHFLLMKDLFKTNYSKPLRQP